MLRLSFTTTFLLGAAMTAGCHAEAGKTSEESGGTPLADSAADSAGDTAGDTDSGVPCVASDEVCNGADDDCDGVIDEGASDATDWFADADGDGYGDPLTVTPSCEAPAGAVADGTDCDDTDGDVHPGAPEVCDGKDDNCDGESDTDRAWYRDADGDGYGDELEESCDAPDGFVSDGTDCDDDNAAVNPGALEICGNGVDDDCDGAAADCRMTGSSAIAGAGTEMTGVEDNAYAGWSVSGGLDATGDGVPDILVGAPYANSGVGADVGAAYLVAGPPAAGSLAGATATFTGAATNDWAGFSVSLCGDLDGDGVSELAIGAYREATAGYNAGSVYIIAGGAHAGTYTVDTEAAGSLVAEAANDNFGWSVAGVGDLDADGYGDIAVGAVQESEAGSGAGAVYLFRGPFAGAVSAADADAKLLGEAANDYAGLSVAGGGDVDGDGLPDLIVGTYAESSAGPASGAAYIVDGGTRGDISLSSATAKLTGESDRARAGYAVGLTDNNGDGYADALVGAPFEPRGGSSCGAAYVINGPISGTIGLAAADATYLAASSADQAGAAVANAGDLDNDGANDILIGAPCDPTGGLCAGSVYVVYGPAVGVSDLGVVAARRYGSTGGAEAGISVSGAGDLDGDGFDDALIGADLTQYGAALDPLGSAYVLYGDGM